MRSWTSRQRSGSDRRLEAFGLSRGADGLPDARLDGYEATRRIRPVFPPATKRVVRAVHIIAMTANTMEGDRDSA